MLQELREQLSPPLSRHQLAIKLGRSPNYILKAESLTFPYPPPSLLDFYTNKLDYPRSLLIEEYRYHQRKRRQSWLSYWRINTSSSSPPTSFVTLWESQFDLQPPTEYAISQGLCIPAAAVYNAEHKPHRKTPKSITTAFQDLQDFALSGEIYAATHLSQTDVEVLLEVCNYYGCRRSGDE